MKQTTYMGRAPQNLDIDNANLINNVNSTMNDSFLGLPDSWGNSVNSNLESRLPLIESMLSHDESKYDNSINGLKLLQPNLILLSGDILEDSSRRVSLLVNYLVDNVKQVINGFEVENYSAMNDVLNRGIQNNHLVLTLLDRDKSRVDCNITKQYLTLLDTLYGTLEDLKQDLSPSSLNNSEKKTRKKTHFIHPEKINSVVGVNNISSSSSSKKNQPYF